MDDNDIRKCKDYLLVYFKMRNEYDETSGLKHKSILVEGETDRNFLKNVCSKDTRLIPVKEIFQARSSFGIQPEMSKINCKLIITTVIQTLSMFPKEYDFPEGAQEWTLYGVVDRDYGVSAALIRVLKLFFTDTHDIETLMLSTDTELLYHISECQITKDDKKKSLYLSMQLAEFRKALKNYEELPQYKINNPDGSVPFECFTENYQINLEKIINHINQRLDSQLPKSKLKSLRESLIHDMKKHLNPQGLRKKPLETFDENNYNDFWNSVNGHDILSALCYISADVKKSFGESWGYEMNRSFEIALSDNYDYVCIYDTDLFNKMQVAKLTQ